MLEIMNTNILFRPEEGKPETCCSNKQKRKVFGFHSIYRTQTSKKREIAVIKHCHFILRQVLVWHIKFPLYLETALPNFSQLCPIMRQTHTNIIFMVWKLDSANFFTFWMYDWTTCYDILFKIGIHNWN